jgi:DNA-binding transcriptional ArsR family regulator
MVGREHCLDQLGIDLSILGHYHARMDHDPGQLNGIFQALADPTRRAVLGRLSKGPVSVSDLAKPFDMALPSFLQHIRFLEASGWIRTRKVGRVRICAIEEKPFAAVAAWLAEQRALWEGRTDRLERFVATVHPEEPPE